MEAPNPAVPEPTLILIPGLLCDESVWSHQAAALASLAEVRIIEHGLLDSLGAMAKNVIAQAPTRFAVAGHSMGGRVALEVLRRVPERITALALLDTAYQPRPDGEAGEREAAERFRLLHKARAEGMRAMGRDWIQRMVHPDRLADHPLVEQILDMIARRTPEQFEAQIRALLHRPDAAPLLPRIKCKTLVLCGAEDAWARLEGHQSMAALIPGCTLRVVPDCGHMSTLERPEAVSAALRAWLARHIGIRSG